MLGYEGGGGACEHETRGRLIAQTSRSEDHATIHVWYISSRKCYNISLFIITQLFLPLCTMAALLLLYHEGPIRDLVTRSR